MNARRSLASCFLLLVILAAPGCAIIGGGDEHVGGHATLDQAAAAANPDSTGKQKRLNVGWTVPRESGAEVSVSGSSYDSGDSRSEEVTPGVELGSGPDHKIFGVVGSGGTIGGSSYDGFGEFGLDLGFAQGRWRFDLIGAVCPIQFADQTIAGQSFRDEFDLQLDVSGRYYLTAGHTFLGAYPIGGLRFGTMFWDYAKPVPILEDGVRKTVDSDQINHFSLYGGFGVGLIQTRHLQVGTQLLGGARFYSWGTKAGFSNTLFAPAGFAQARLEAGLRF